MQQLNVWGRGEEKGMGGKRKGDREVKRAGRGGRKGDC